jgi:hypothetical protein
MWVAPQQMASFCNTISFCHNLELRYSAVHEACVRYGDQRACDWEAKKLTKDGKGDCERNKTRT